MKTIATATHIGAVRQTNQSQVQQVCIIINWSEEQYCNYLFEQYVAFVELLFERYPIMQKQVLYNPVMRGFWNNEVNKRNKNEFLNFAVDLTTRKFELIKAQIKSHEIILAGVECTEPMPFGAPYLIDEFMLTHNYLRLRNDEEFMHHYNRTLKLIR